MLLRAIGVTMAISNIVIVLRVIGAVASVGAFTTVAVADAVLEAIVESVHVEIVGVAIVITCIEGSIVVRAKTIVGQTVSVAGSYAVGVVSDTEVFSSALII